VVRVVRVGEAVVVEGPAAPMARLMAHPIDRLMVRLMVRMVKAVQTVPMVPAARAVQVAPAARAVQVAPAVRAVQVAPAVPVARQPRPDRSSRRRM